VTFDDGGFRRTAVSKADFEGSIASLKYALGVLMSSFPRMKGESIADYRDRLRTEGAGDGWWSLFRKMAICVAHIQRIELEESNERARIADEGRQRQRDEEERKRQERAQWERDASPDPKEIKRLLAVIDEASEARRLLALIDSANVALLALGDIYEKEREACMRLGKPVPKPSKYGLTITQAEAPLKRDITHTPLAR
jgi:hypothetical protein